MRNLLGAIKQGNALLYRTGWICIWGALLCLILMYTCPLQVMGINAWVKPLKFFLSIAIFLWSMGYYMLYLPRPTAVKAYSVMAVGVFIFELAVVMAQAGRGQLSHFNISTPLNSLLFSFMGIAITLLTVWTAVIAVYFFKCPAPPNLEGFWWGIRLGLICFVIFSFEGGLMAARLQHTVGAPDGGPGLALVNWSRQHGDLRIAHFIGMHALQVLPILGCFLFKKPVQILTAALVYAGIATWLFMRAMAGQPLFF